MVGALARFNLNFDQLHPKAKAAAAALGLKPKCINPYMNTVAQVVEIVALRGRRHPADATC